MYSRYEQRQERTSHEYDRVGDSYDSTASGGTTTSTYRTAITPRVINISQRPRQSAFGGSGGGVMTRVYQSIQSGRSGSFGPGLASLANFPGVPMRGSGTSTALVGFNATRQREKRDLEQLNDKFAQYVEKVRFLEAQNKKLDLELGELRKRSGQGSSRIKEMYDIEIDEANRLIAATKKDAADANGKTQQAEQELKRQKDRYNNVSGAREADRKEVDALQRQIAENEAQINLFRRRMADLEDEARRYKGEGQRIGAEISRLQNEIQNQRFLKSSCEVEKLALEDELTSLKHTHETVLADLRSKSVSNDLDPSHFFRNELAQAIREIRNDYENLVENQRNDMQNRYSLLYNELIIRQQRPDGNIQNEQQRRQEERLRSEISQTQSQHGYLRAENENMKNRIGELERKLNLAREDASAAQAKRDRDLEDARRRLERANNDFNEVSNLKTSLEKEIGTYRELLESQNGLRGYVDRIVQNAEQQALDRPSSARPITGGSTTITRTYINTTGPSYSSGNAGGFGGLNSLVSESIRPSSAGYQTISSGIRSTLRDSAFSDAHTRNSGDF
ncbi:unnamed protein product [Adineta ricciae]|uniref:IF rod domain-containing protein n=1 Tax=Adineta ricciae TaxID=249248 RepID=A0A813PWW7_ADIRI|nr:unnamed protein product [Adineta ricciae]